MRPEPCREWRQQLGAFALGHLPEQERRATGAHLEGCPACRAEAESLAPLAHLLPKADPSGLGAAPAPPAHLGERISARVAGEARRRRGRRRTRLGLALAGAGTAAAVLAGVLVGGESERSPAADTEGSRVVAFDSLPHGMKLAATLRPRSFGTEIRMRVRGVHSGTLCRVFLRSAGGAAMPAGSFRYRYGREAVLTSALDLSAARAVGVRAYGETFMAPLRRGGAPHPPRATAGESNS